MSTESHHYYPSLSICPFIIWSHSFPALLSSLLFSAALSYVDDKYLKKPEDVLKAVSVLLANELCLEPSIRHTAKVMHTIIE